MSSEIWSGLSIELYERLAACYGTPYFLYDADAVSERIRQVRTALRGVPDVFYAVKANPNLALLKAIRHTVDGLDISSEGELAQSVLAGFEPAQLSFAGPGKTRTELHKAVEAGVGCISVESLRQLDDIASVATDRRRSAHIVLRVNPEKLIRSFGLKMGGRSTQFGVEESEVLNATEVIKRSKYLQFKGIHSYVGSQCFDPEGIAEHTENTLCIASELEAASGLHCSVINLGGGFGVSHSRDQHELDLAEVGRLVSPLLNEFRQHRGRERSFVFELGRYLTAHAGVYVCRVVSEKRSRGKSFIIADGGLHHHLAAAGTFGTALRSNYEVRNLTNPEGPTSQTSIAGPSCNPTDLLAVDVDLPEARVGHLLAVMNSGSYGLTASPLLFLGRRTPAEIVHREGEFALGRRAMEMTEFN